MNKLSKIENAEQIIDLLRNIAGLEDEISRRRNRRLSDPGDVPTPPSGCKGLPIPASQDRLRRSY